MLFYLPVFLCVSSQPSLSQKFEFFKMCEQGEIKIARLKSPHNNNSIKTLILHTIAKDDVSAFLAPEKTLTLHLLNPYNYTLIQ
jgi:hypothetical protein